MRSKDPAIYEEIIMFVDDYCRENHEAPTVRTVADGVGISRATAQRYLAKLGEQGKLDYRAGIKSIPDSAKCDSDYIATPLLGTINCGPLMTEEENIEKYISLPTTLFGSGDFYILRAQGDSMIDVGIEEGDLLVINRKLEVRTGDVIVALDENGQNTLKVYGGYDPEMGMHVLRYMNHIAHPDEVILVRNLYSQGVASTVIKSLR